MNGHIQRDCDPACLDVDIDTCKYLPQKQYCELRCDYCPPKNVGSSSCIVPTRLPPTTTTPQPQGKI